MIDAPLRLGCVNYLNARPLIHGWPGAVEFDHPATLSRKLAAGELDVALVSSFEFLRNPIYAIVDNVAIASDGPVYSVFVVYQGKLEETEEIALDPASETSVNLLRCLLAERNLRPRLTNASQIESATNSPQARLLIGDQAIRYRQRHASEYDFWDLGEEWKRATGLPFVFALWLIRPERDDASEIAAELRARRDTNFAALDDIISEQTDFSRDFCASYYRHYLRFQFAEREKDGLLLFRSVCQKHGILSPIEVPLRLL